MTTTMWVPNPVHVAMNAHAPFVQSVQGHTYRGLGMVRRDPLRLLIHLGTGHVVARIRSVDEERAFAIATEIAEAVPWSEFDTLQGWQNVAPDLHERVWAIANRYPAELIVGRGETDGNQRAAAAVQNAREAI